jgi:hypothetical protein
LLDFRECTVRFSDLAAKMGRVEVYLN